MGIWVCVASAILLLVPMIWSMYVCMYVCVYVYVCAYVYVYLCVMCDVWRVMCDVWCVYVYVCMCMCVCSVYVCISRLHSRSLSPPLLCPCRSSLSLHGFLLHSLHPFTHFPSVLTPSRPLNLSTIASYVSAPPSTEDSIMMHTWIKSMFVYVYVRLSTLIHSYTHPLIQYCIPQTFICT